MSLLVVQRWDNEGLAAVSTTHVRRLVMRLAPEQLALSAKAASNGAAAKDSSAAKKARTSAATSSRSKAKIAKVARRTTHDARHTHAHAPTTRHIH
jgi:hypothetical protein